MSAPRSGLSSGHTQVCTHFQTHSHRSTDTLTDTLSEVTQPAFTGSETHAGIHVCTHCSQTQIHAPHLSASGDRQRTQRWKMSISIRVEARCPCSGPHPLLQRWKGKSPAGCPETVFTSRLCPIPGASRARGAFSLKAVCLRTCVKVGLPGCSRSPPGRVSLTQDCVTSCRHAGHVVQGDWGQQAKCKRVQVAWGEGAAAQMGLWGGRGRNCSPGVRICWPHC